MVSSSQKLILSLLLCSGGILTASAQTAPAPASATDPSTTEPPVKLSPFTVKDTKASDYGATEATSTTRIAEPIQDVAQSISVVTANMMNDTGGFRILDTAKYVTPINDPGALEGGDRYMLRGFFISRRFIDGVTVSGQDGFNMTSDQTNIERLEIIKGPNSILVPGGSPGGQVNIITKSPKFTNFEEALYEYKEYFNNELSFDVNHVLNDSRTSAARVVAAVWDRDNGYFTNYFRKGWLVAPSYTYLFGDQTQLTVKLESFYNKESQLAGQPFDQMIPGNGILRLSPMVPRNFQYGGKDFYRERWETRLTSEFDFKISDQVSSRLWLMADHATRNDRGAGDSGSDPSRSANRYNPLTGLYTPLTIFTYDPATRTVTSTPTPLVTVYQRSTQANLIKFDELHFKNDYVTNLTLNEWLKSTTVAGIAANYSHISWINWSASNPQPVDFLNLAATQNYNPNLTTYKVNINKTASQTDGQIFAYEQLSAWDNRVILTGGISEFIGELKRLDNGSLPVTAGTFPYNLRTSTTDANVGLVYKPITHLSLYAGYNKVGGGLPSSITAGQNPANFTTQVGDQVEAGVKGTFLDGRLMFSSAVYRITQSNFATPNPAFIFNPAPGTPTFLYYNVKSTGVEFETTALLAENLNLVFNIAHNHTRNDYGAPQNLVPDDSAALFLRYTFNQSILRNFSVSLGLDYSGRMASMAQTGLTPAGVPYQPRGIVPAHTLAQLGFGYTYQRFNAKVLIDNLTNTYTPLGFTYTLPRSLTFEIGYKL